MRTPINPKTIAVDLFIPNFSPKIGTAKTAAKNRGRVHNSYIFR